MAAPNFPDDKAGDEKPHLEDDATQCPPIDRRAEKRLLRKLDSFILPWVILIYVFSFLDRINVGNARLYGLEKELELSGNDFQVVSAVLFATYITFEIPSNLVLKKASPSRWIAFITTSWGIVATLTGIAQSYGGLIVARLFLGAFEVISTYNVFALKAFC